MSNSPAIATDTPTAVDTTKPQQDLGKPVDTKPADKPADIKQDDNKK